MTEPEHLARDRAHRAAGDELAGLVLDALVPEVNRLRLLTANRLGLTVHEMACLDLLRRFGPSTTDLLGDRTGLTRSGLSRLLRRLEEKGHVTRSFDDAHAQRVVVTLVPHTERDDAADLLRLEVRIAMAAAAAEAGLDRRRELAGAVAIVRYLTTCLFRSAQVAGDRVAARRRHRQRLRERPRVID
jgi:DNA-binding MarR family transcriptional regulator